MQDKDTYEFLSKNNYPIMTDGVMRSLTFGEKAVGLTFNPGNNPDVQKMKEAYAAIIDVLNDKREKAGREGGAGRHFSLAITDAEDAQMRAVKAITWVD